MRIVINMDYGKQKLNKIKNAIEITDNIFITKKRG